MCCSSTSLASMTSLSLFKVAKPCVVSKLSPSMSLSTPPPPAPAGGSPPPAGQSYLVATVGDDNALAVCLLTLSPPSSLCGSPHPPSLRARKLCEILSAHSSSIVGMTVCFSVAMATVMPASCLCTGVGFASSSCLMTTSTDQRLRVWRLRRREEWHLELASELTHSVADTAVMATYNSRWGGLAASLTDGQSFLPPPPLAVWASQRLCVGKDCSALPGATLSI